MNEFNKIKNGILGFAMILLAVSLAVAVITAERQTAVEMGVSIWQKSFNAHIATTVAILTAIVMAVIVALKKLGLTRWLFAGVPIALIAIVFEWASFYAYFEGMGKDYSDKQKSSSISKQALDASFQKLNPASLAIEIDGSGSEDNEKALELNKQSALAEKELIKCNNVKGWKTKRACQTKWEANLANSNRQLDGIANLQNETHLKHSEKIAEVQALISLRNIAKKEELNQIPYPQFDMIESQSFAFKIAAGAIVFLNLTLFFVGFGLIGFKLHDNLDSENITSHSYPRPAPAMATRSNAGSWRDGTQSGWSAMWNKAKSALSKNTATAFAPSHSPSHSEPEQFTGHSEPEHAQEHVQEPKKRTIGFAPWEDDLMTVSEPELTVSEPELTVSEPELTVSEPEPTVSEEENERKERLGRVVDRALARKITVSDSDRFSLETDEGFLPETVETVGLFPETVNSQKRSETVRNARRFLARNRLKKSPLKRLYGFKEWRKGRGKSDVFGYEKLVTEIQNPKSSLFWRGRITLKRVMPFCNCAYPNAVKLIERLKQDGYLNGEGEVNHG